MLKLGVVLSLAVVLVACFESEPAPPKEKEWESTSLAGGALTFSMPHSADTKTTESGSGEERIKEEIAVCSSYEEGLGECFFGVTVLSGPSLGKEMGPDPVVRRTWSKFLIVDLIAAETGHVNEEEGKWSFTEEGGYWLRASAPPNPPKRTVPVMIWLRVAPFGDRALIQKFVCTKGWYENETARPKIDGLREKFLSSFSAKGAPGETPTPPPPDQPGE